jgi:hypothetical protein
VLCVSWKIAVKKGDFHPVSRDVRLLISICTKILFVSSALQGRLSAMIVHRIHRKGDYDGQELKRLPVILQSIGLLLVDGSFCAKNSLASSKLLTLRYVASNGNCGARSPAMPAYRTAVDAAMDGDELRVAAGRYTGVSARGGISQLVYLDKSITIQGGYHPQNWTLNPDLNPRFWMQRDRGVSVHPLVISRLWWTGFHLVNGSADYAAE